MSKPALVFCLVNAVNLAACEAPNLDAPASGSSQTAALSFDPAASYFILGVSSGKALDVQGGSGADGALVQQYSLHGGPNQQWNVQDAGGGTFKIVSRASGKALDVQGGSTADGAIVQQWSYVGAAHQRFDIVDNSDGSQRILAAHSGKAVDIAGASNAESATVQQWSYAGGGNQRFRFTRVGGWDANTSYTITSKRSGKALDVGGALQDNGARVQQWTYAGGGNQQWRIADVGGGFFTIGARHSGKVLDVPGGTASNGAPIHQWAYGGGGNQHWRIDDAGGGLFKIISRATGKSLDVAAASAADGASVQQWDYHGGDNQLWRIEKSAAATAGGGATIVNTPPPPGAPSTLRDAAASTGRLFGTAVQARWLTDGRYADVLSRQFGYITPENEMKWDVLQPSRNQFNFASADAIVNFAASRGMRVKGHTLVWHQQLPSWVASMTNTADIRAVMLNHIRTVVGRYRGRVHAWDVVNEAIDDAPGHALRSSVFMRLGETFIDEAFRAAHEADPNALLFYNDYGTEGMGGKCDAAYRIAQRLKNNGVPIHGVGVQMHVRAQGWPTTSDISQNMARLAALGLLVNISEIDVNICGLGGDDAYKLAVQRQRYHDIVATCVAQPRCDAITAWGITDGQSWLNSAFPCSPMSPRGLLFDDGYGQKPAYWGTLDALLRR